MNKLYELKNLDCANCAAKIENKISKLEYIDNCNVDFLSKKLTIALKSNFPKNYEKEIIKIIKKIKDDISIETYISQYELEFNIRNLKCANCSIKIEKEIKELNYIIEANINMVNEKISIKSQIDNIDKILKDINQIKNKYEPSVIIDKNTYVKEKIHSQDELKKLYIGAGVFIIGLMLNKYNMVSAIFLLCSYFILIKDILIDTIKSFKHGLNINENTLISIATVSAIILGEIPEAIAVVLFYSIGEYFQEKAVGNSKKSIHSLLKLKPDYANILINDKINKISPSELKIGDIIIVRPGEKIPVDGIIIEGISNLDTVAITGESMPRTATINDNVFSGFINNDNILKIRVTEEYKNSTISKILDLVENANKNKAKSEKFITKFSRIYTPIVVLLAVLLSIIPPIILQDASFSTWIYRALTFLVISCPCALVLSIPLSFFNGIGGAAKQGILFKGSSYLEVLSEIDTAVFDKTGTLTEGIFKVNKVNIERNISKEEFIRYAAYAEFNSTHPIAQSIVKYFKEDINVSKISNYKETPGYGVEATIDDKRVVLGNKKFMTLNNIEFAESNDIGTIIYMAINNQYMGYILISDSIKKDVVDIVNKLKQIGIKEVVMLTGDRQNIAEKISNELKIDKTFANLLPTDKADIIKNLMSSGRKTVFIGDGINDAPVIATSNIGVSMGGLGSDVAVETADIVFMTDEPSKLETAIKLSKKTMKIVKQNIIFAIGVKVLFLILASLGYTSMWIAVFADVGVSILAILNSMRANKI